MAKFSGRIAFSNQVETTPGVWVKQVTERDYFGDVIKESRQWSANGVNDNLVVSNRISILADDFANTNFSSMLYVIWYGQYWKVSNVEIQRPRMILTLGGVYNGPKA